MRRHGSCTLLVLAASACSAEDGVRAPPLLEGPYCTTAIDYEAGRCPTDRAPRPDPPAGFLIISRDEHLFRADFDGCGARRITGCPAENASFGRRFAGASADGNWLAYSEYYYMAARARMLISRSDASQVVHAHGVGLMDSRNSVFTENPAALVLETGSFYDEELWVASLPNGEATRIGGKTSRLATASPDGSVLVYSMRERVFTAGDQQVFWRLDLHTRERIELARATRDDWIWSPVVTRDARWAVYAWARPAQTSTRGWTAIDASGARVSGELDIRELMLPGAGNDLIAIGDSEIMIVDPTAAQARRIYQVPAGKKLMRILSVPSARKLLFTEVSPVPDRNNDPSRGDLIELDLDTGSTAALGGSSDLHVPELVSSDGERVLEGVFRLPCPEFYISNDRLSGRIATVLHDRRTGRSRTLSNEPRAIPLGFSSDSRAVILALPLGSEAEWESTRVHRYRIEAYLIDTDETVHILDHEISVELGYGEHWDVHVIPSPHGRVTHIGDLVCP